ncbi:uncharacterized protein EI90DRAFT_3125369 [Cantharellus anzutake]|uniref:uncharacterized protein n=1 Tax=Cantharellus anzutake TaxID=1750568 RepID=UPI001907C9A5|nr:uncharacterized protein EI90DRAFT_3125369 [Cantharellus anzutake]KAF8329072.1 hypothetical protein EI90DRAFT_3125369 [Cantharellus anzutake]
MPLTRGVLALLQSAVAYQPQFGAQYYTLDTLLHFLPAALVPPQVLNHLALEPAWSPHFPHSPQIHTSNESVCPTVEGDVLMGYMEGDKGVFPPLMLDLMEEDSFPSSSLMPSQTQR